MLEGCRHELGRGLRDAQIWHLGQGSPIASATIPTGFPELDALLPGGGWPLGALTEILTNLEGIGALRLVIPALAHLSRIEKWLTWIAPLHIPYAPALAAHGVDLTKVLIVQGTISPRVGLWAMEQSLRSGACGAVLAWPTRIDWRELRRLQLAAEIGLSWGLIFRSHATAHEASPAALRIALTPSGTSMEARIIKCRGGARMGSVSLDIRLSPVAW